ncbi:MAG: ABC transporter ATP-binding protein [Methanomicrobia archaeon]|nr:ABC transporter ATP-binding protein [Methanomicrobia archaeon]RLF95588.1 MAG: ABC transporter ATP-binding protein [Thermococci archaeon]RLF95889.1 MAG: ABC transporter ATP-binding protein [Thermococci archaeon]RLG00889.1 MAG: ABC transporter ATP-binding protein [Thermococci archaeon]HEC95930.1 ABC transporter ATP-binding protein [Euryarchaeota archaeon]
MDTILEIEELEMSYQTIKGFVSAVDNVSFKIMKGESMGLVGESGCGKTSLGMCIMKLLPENARIMNGKILFDGEDIVPKTEEEMRKIRWKGVSMIFQAAMNALNPVYRVGDQIIEAIQTHDNISKEEAREKVEKLYELVGLSPERMKNYPHEYSGGMRQRAIIAMALACDPKFIIADEPTTALDVIVQDQIIDEIVNLQKKLNMTMMYISHDISVIAETCNKIGVMYAGNIVEYTYTSTLFDNPLHPYTKALMSSFPSIEGPKKELKPVPGEPPNLLNPPEGCRFYPRCSYAEEICKKENPEFVEIEKDHFLACHKVI